VRAPPRLREGNLIAIVAPSSPFDDDRYKRGAAWLAERYRIRQRDDVFARAGYLAGDDARRRSELRAALVDPEVRAVVAARGGYGATRFSTELDWTELARDPKWVVGFSDVTALHVEAQAVGVRSLHAPMLAALGAADDDTRVRWLRALEHDAREPWRVEPWIEGEAEGVSCGGNLALLEACAAMGRLRLPERAILFVEDCTERPYRLDRMLTSLLVGGHLGSVRGVVLGEFTDCAPGPDGVTADAVLRERFATLGVPVVARAPFGHGAVNEPFELGRRVRLRGDRVEWG
jgi:muramoyltetrapeptide carboxypeptidase